MLTEEIDSALTTIERNAALFAAINFDDRVEALDRIEFEILDRLDAAGQTTSLASDLLLLRERAEALKGRLEEVDNRLFQELRGKIQAGALRGSALRELFGQYVGRVPGSRRKQAEAGYDNLDLFLDGLLLTGALPDETLPRDPEMVYYQQTPARVILELVEKARFTAQDVFYDLGSGLGQVPMTANLLGGVPARGVEFEPAYCDYAQGCAAALNLPLVEFRNQDARQADYAGGTVFFMYTPFVGHILQAVLEKLQAAASRKPIRLFTYGVCSAQVARCAWLRSFDGNPAQPHQLVSFTCIERQ